jgi:hypothetical protein
MVNALTVGGFYCKSSLHISLYFIPFYACTRKCKCKCMGAARLSSELNLECGMAKCKASAPGCCKVVPVSNPGPTNLWRSM